MKKRDAIRVRGARVNNLQNIDIDVPRNKLVVVTGLSGSGKSSLAFDTIYAEGNRRYMESLSSYARSILDVSAKADVDSIENLGPSISIDQRSVARSPRSTVGTLTEIYDYLRVLFARVGELHCPQCNTLMQRKTNKEILEEIFSFSPQTKIAILAPMEEKKKSVPELLRMVQQQGYARVRFGEKIMTVSEALLVASATVDVPIAVVIDRFEVNPKNPDKARIIDSIETAMKIGGGTILVAAEQSGDRRYDKNYKCHTCNIVVDELHPRHFSFNHPEGACSECDGLGKKAEIDATLLIPNNKLSLEEGAIHIWSKSGGKMDGMDQNMEALRLLARRYNFSLTASVKTLSKAHLALVLYGVPEEMTHSMRSIDDVQRIQRFVGVIPDLERKYRDTKSEYLRSEIERYMTTKVCQMCDGKRLRPASLSVRIAEYSIDDVVHLSLPECREFFSTLSQREELSHVQRMIAEPLVKEIVARLVALENVGLDYLSLSRSSETLSGGEAQRIRLAVQIKSELTGIVYVLDEPTVGLHSRDTKRLIDTLIALRDVGNSLVVVEHDADVMRAADWIIDMGPGAGEDGGKVIFTGSAKTLQRAKTSTAQYITKKKFVSDKKLYRRGNRKYLEITKAAEHNLKDITVKIPLEKFVVVSGVSGSGKSTLVNTILARALAQKFYKAKAQPGAHKAISGVEHINKVIAIDQEPIGRTPRSNAATYTGVFGHIRKLFAAEEDAIDRDYTASHFSFNMRGGRCEVCQGDGHKKVEMYMLPDIYIPCEACQGARYNMKTLDVTYNGVNIAEVLEMSVEYALQFFKTQPLIKEKLSTMKDVGLGYLKLGQSATNLSGGEAQRIKLATELARKTTGKTLYILDEPTIGLHFDDVKRLLRVLDELVNKGNTVLVVEHNLDVIAHADWVVDLGPDGGKNGGEVVFEGTPDKLKKAKKSWTAKYL